MPRLKEIENVVHNAQEDILNNSGSLPGSCESSKNIALDLKGWVYITDQPSNFGQDHKVAVVKQKGSNEGKVIDVTQKEPFIGVVSDLRNVDKVVQELNGLFGINGWRLMLDYSK